MTGDILNIEDEALQNNFFREVLYTAQHSQLLVMSLCPMKILGWKHLKSLISS
jgi:hypothetical protein